MSIPPDLGITVRIVPHVNDGPISSIGEVLFRVVVSRDGQQLLDDVVPLRDIPGVMMQVASGIACDLAGVARMQLQDHVLGAFAALVEDFRESIGH